MQAAGLCAVAFIHKHKYLPACAAWLRLQFFYELFEIVHTGCAELVHQRTQQARLGLAQQRQQVAAAAGARDRLAGFHEYAFNLLVQLVAVGDDGHAAIRQVFQYPFGQQHHHNAFAAALSVPDDAALALLHM